FRCVIDGRSEIDLAGDRSQARRALRSFTGRYGFVHLGVLILVAILFHLIVVDISVLVVTFPLRIARLSPRTRFADDAVMRVVLALPRAAALSSILTIAILIGL